MKMLYKKESGFTLIEILIVVLIIGIIAALAIPNLQSARKTSYQQTCRANRATLASAAELFNIQTGGYPSAVSDMWNKQTVAGVTYDAVMTRPMDCPMVPITSTSKGSQYTIDEDTGEVICAKVTASDHDA